MQAHKMRVVIPRDHRLTVQVPEDLSAGPAELILLVPAPSAGSESPSARSSAGGRLAALHAELVASDSRPFHQLDPEQRQRRLQKIRGAGRGLLSTSEEFERRKREEIIR